MFTKNDSRYNRNSTRLVNPRHRQNVEEFAEAQICGIVVVSLLHNTGDVSLMIAHITNPAFWNKKVKIGILVLATFIAMC